MMRRALLAAALGGACAVTAAAQRPSTAALPREVGPVRLGMPAQAFARLGHVIPECAPADGCGPHETRASAFIDTLPPDVTGLPGVQQFTALFIRDSLYSMSIRPPESRLNGLRSYYSGLYGPPQREDTTDDGGGLLIWESKITRLVVHYVRNAAPGGPPYGTVTSVEYIDVRLAKEAEIDRGNRPWP